MRRERRRTLYLEANGCGRHVVLADTVLRGLLRYRDGETPPRMLARSRRVRLLFAHLRDFHASLSYTVDWREAFCAAPELDVEVCNINNLAQYARCLARIRSFDLVVVSHAAAGDDMTILRQTARWLERRQGPLVLFIGNEYDLLDEKMTFARRTTADVLCSQLPEDAARYLYGDLGGTRIVSLPHALNPRLYHPDTTVERTVDVGFIGDLYWPFIGDEERTRLVRSCAARGPALGLSCDIRTTRVERPAWADFLRRCRAVIGAESGTYYLNDRGRLLAAARAYNLRVPTATFEEVFDRFYRGRRREVSGKSISSRHFEPIGTKTCQVLLDGDYNGILKPDEHYIAVRRDLSNLDDALRQLRDAAACAIMAERTYEYVMSAHTYAHRVQTLLRLLA